jgi:hypothetical protein
MMPAGICFIAHLGDGEHRPHGLKGGSGNSTIGPVAGLPGRLLIMPRRKLPIRAPPVFDRVHWKLGGT